jgi:tetratricopeptide (TPR) repeat protein
MNDWVNRRWYAIAELCLVFTCAALMMILPSASGWLFLISLLPSLVRLLTGALPNKTTPLDVPMALFLITACLGVWVSYNRNAAWAKFWLIAEAILLFYVISRQPQHNLRVVAGLIIALEIFLVSWFLLAYDWKTSPIEFNMLNRVGMWWENIRPEIASGSFPADKAGDLIATFLPFALLLVFLYPKTRRWPGLLFGLAVIGFGLSGLLLTSSIASWLALAVAGGVWLFWQFSSLLARRLSKKMFIVYGITMLLITLGVAGIGLVFFGKTIASAHLQSSSNISIGRLELATDTLRLVNDYPFTGGGLAAFAGQYSRYILDIPVFFFNTSHNLYLDIAFEQSPAGLLAWLAVLGVSFLLLLNSHQKSPLWWAVVLSLIVVSIQGFADDPLYGGNGTALLFVLPGLVVALHNPGEVKERVELSKARNARKKLLWIALSGLLASILLISLSLPILKAQWAANLGAIDMAKVELAGFPSGKWDEGQNIPALAEAESLYQQSLAADQGNFTAHYRLGLIGMLARDFETAQPHLENALAIQSGHRGVRKELGYCYLWMGDYEQALPLLASLSETQNELDAYIWWWNTQGRGDLAGRAETMRQELQESSSYPAP